MTALALLALLAGHAAAWGPLGHRVVATVAEQRLSDAARAELAALLPPGSTLARLSTCADDMLYQNTTLDCGGFDLEPDAKKTSQPWHFLNVPAGAAIRAEADLVAYCPKGDCAVAQIERWAKALALSPSLEERRLALMYLTHLVADAHQPLHALAPDALGEDFKKFDYHGQKKSLHNIWDDLMRTESWPEQFTMDPSPLVAAAHAALAAQPAARADAAEMVAESVQLAQAHEAHRDYFARGLGLAYVAWYEPVIHRRLAEAGARLAAVLEPALTHKGIDAASASARAAAVLPSQD